MSKAVSDEDLFAEEMKGVKQLGKNSLDFMAKQKLHFLMNLKEMIFLQEEMELEHLAKLEKSLKITQ